MQQSSHAHNVFWGEKYIIYKYAYGGALSFTKICEVVILVQKENAYLNIYICRVGRQVRPHGCTDQYKDLSVLEPGL